MTWHDEILEEIWKVREEFARAFNNDALAMGKALLEEEKKSDWPTRTPPRREPQEPRAKAG